MKVILYGYMCGIQVDVLVIRFDGRQCAQVAVGSWYIR